MISCILLLNRIFSLSNIVIFKSGLGDYVTSSVSVQAKKSLKRLLMALEKSMISLLCQGEEPCLDPALWQCESVEDFKRGLKMQLFEQR